MFWVIVRDLSSLNPLASRPPCRYRSSHGAGESHIRPALRRAILLPPVLVGGLGSRLRVSPKPPHRGGFRVLGSWMRKFADDGAASNIEEVIHAQHHSRSR